MSENAGPGPTSLNVALDSSKSVRDAAKWLLAAFAAVFAVLTGGLQISALVRLANSPWALLAIICGVVAFGAVSIVIFRAAKVLIDPGVSLEDLLERETSGQLSAMNSKLQGKNDVLELDANDSLLKGLRGIKSLTHHQTDSPTELRDALRTARRAAMSASTRPTPAESVAEADVLLLLSTANRVHNAGLFSKLMMWVRIAAIVVPLAVAGIAWMSVTTSNVSTVVTGPVNARVLLSEEVERTALGLGESCRSTSLDAVLIGGTLDRPLVVTTETALCRSAKFVVTPEIGISVPLIK